MKPVRPPAVPRFRTLLDRTGALTRGNRFLAGRGAAPAVEPSPEVTAPAAASVPRPRHTRFHRPSWLTWPLLDRSTVTASLEGSSLRLVSFSGPRVLGWASIPLDHQIIRGGQIGDPPAVGSAIDEAFDRLQLSRRRVAWALPGFQATTRILDLPGLRGERLRRAIFDELEPSLGVALDDSYLFSERLEGRVRGRNVFVLTLPKLTVLTALEALEAAGIRPATMDLRPLALARAVGRADAIIANLEEGSLDLVVVAGGVPTLLRSVPLPTTATAEVAQGRLVDEVDRALRYYDDTIPERPLSADAALYLSGRLATGIALAEKLRAVTGHPIGHLTTDVTYPADFPVGEYLVNIGLALKRW